MIYINSLQDIVKAYPQLTDSAIRFLKDFFNDLQELLKHANVGGSFHLTDHGYILILLEPMESPLNIQTAMAGTFGVHLEYAERIDLQDVQLFKVCLMNDNESFTFIFSVVGTQARELETRFADLADGWRIA